MNREEIDNLDYQDYCKILKPCLSWIQNSISNAAMLVFLAIGCVPFSENTYIQEYKTIS